MQDARLLWAYKAALLLHGRFVGYSILFVSVFILILNIADVTLDIGWGYTSGSIFVGLGSSLMGFLIVVGERLLSKKMSSEMTSLKTQEYPGTISLTLRAVRAFALAFMQVALPGVVLSLIAGFLGLKRAENGNVHEVVANYADMALIFVVMGIVWATVVLVLFLRRSEE